MNRIAIVTPTMTKRSDWVSLQRLYYYHVYNNSEGISIYYATDDIHNAYDAVRAILPKINDEYIVFAGDDDFHIPEQLHKTADFLDLNPAYIGAYGDGLLVQLENWKIGWTANYNRGMAIERAFSVTCTDMFKEAMKSVPVSRLRGREIMNAQNKAFIAAMHRLGKFKVMSGLQTIHCHHSDRGELETSEAYFRTMAEKYGGGWLASWLPSRSCSRRNLERKRAPHHTQFMYFKEVVNQYAETKNTLHHTQFSVAGRQ